MDKNGIPSTQGVPSMSRPIVFYPVYRLFINFTELLEHRCVKFWNEGPV